MTSTILIPSSSAIFSSPRTCAIPVNATNTISSSRVGYSKSKSHSCAILKCTINDLQDEVRALCVAMSIKDDECKQLKCENLKFKDFAKNPNRLKHKLDRRDTSISKHEKSHYDHLFPGQTTA